MAPAPVDPPTELDHGRGAREGAPGIVLIEYGDYDCPHTRAAQAVVDRLAQENPDLLVVFRHFPLRHLHVNAERLARLAEAAARQDRFWPMHDHLMHHRRAIDEQAIHADLTDVGIDLARVGRDTEDPTLAARIERDLRSGRASGVHSTPSFFFDGVLHDGHYDYQTLAARLAAARERRGDHP